MTGCVAEIQQTAFAEHEHRVAIGEDVLVDLWLDVDAHDVAEAVEAGHVDFVVEVTNVADDRLVLHAGHVFGRDDAKVAGRRDEDVSGFHDVLDPDDFEALHGGLQCADRVNLGDHDACALALKCRSAALADIAVAANDGDLAAEHDVGAAVDAVDERVADAVQVVELRLGNRVVDVDCREQQRALVGHRCQAVHAGRGLFAHATDAGCDLVPELVVACVDLAKLVEEHAPLFAGVFFGVGDTASLFELEALVDHHRGVAAVVEDQVRALAVRPVEQLLGCPPVLLERLALPCKDRRAAWCVDGSVGTDGDGSRSVVLGREDVAGHPAHVSAERNERLDQYSGLDRHVERTDDASASKWLLIAVTSTECDQAGHFVLGKADLFAAEFGERQIGDLEVRRVSHMAPQRYGTGSSPATG